MANVRFQKRIKLLPFLWLNISKSGMSLTVGGRLIKFNIGRLGVWLSGAIPGTGLSVRHKIAGGQGEKEQKAKKEATEPQR